MPVSCLLMLIELRVNSACEISASVALLARRAAVFSQHAAACARQESVAFSTQLCPVVPFALRSIVSALFVGSEGIRTF